MVELKIDSEDFANEIANQVRKAIKEELKDYFDEVKEQTKKDRYMTVTQVAEYLGKTPQTIYNYLKEGKLKAHYANGLKAFLKSDIDNEFINKY